MDDHEEGLAQPTGTLPIASTIDLDWRDPVLSLSTPGIHNEATLFDHRESAIISSWPEVLRRNGSDQSEKLPAGLLIGRDRESTEIPSNFTGEIDELFVFEAAITEERIKTLIQR